MKNRTRVSFSDNTVHVTLPKAWTEFTQDELRDVYRLCASHQGQVNLMFAVFRYLTGLRIERCQEERYQIRFMVDGKPRRLWISPDKLLEYLEPLEFIKHPGADPVRIAWLKTPKVKAVDASLHGVKFSDYLQLENLYQGYISSRNPEALKSISENLYPGYDRQRGLEPFEVFNLIQWAVQIKANFARQFRNFFRPVAGEVETPEMLEVMNNQIRALTGGDVTKEQEIFDTDCWRALTELDYKSKEAEEYRRKSKS